ncbi:MAG: hypothetical protein ACI85J_000544 [Candidatus Poriferisodalaceae bacterium]|jgi:hypothetical protein
MKLAKALDVCASDKGNSQLDEKQRYQYQKWQSHYVDDLN